MKKLLKNKFFMGWLFTITSLVLLVTPNMIWFYINRETYFEHGTTRLSIGAMLTLVYILALLKGAFKEIDKRLSTMISMCVFLAIVWFFDMIISDLYWIVLCGIIGYLFYLVFALVGSTHLEHHKAYKDEKMRVRARTEVNDDLGSV